MLLALGNPKEGGGAKSQRGLKQKWNTKKDAKIEVKNQKKKKSLSPTYDLQLIKKVASKLNREKEKRNIRKETFKNGTKTIIITTRG